MCVCPAATETEMFNQLHAKLLFPNLIQRSYRILEQYKKQNSSEVAKCILNAIEKSVNGAIYLIEDEKLTTVQFKYERTDSLASDFH